MKIRGIHHVAIICSDYERSKKFYTELLGLEIVQEVYRQERDSYKLDLRVDGVYQIELFSFPDPKKRPTRPEAAGLRHLAFCVDDVVQAVQYIQSAGIETEEIRLDPYTTKRFVFFQDPDGLPIELYEG